MPGRKKRIEKKIESLEERVKEHEGKKAQYNGVSGKEDVVKYWAGEIDEYKRQIYEARAVLGRKKKNK
jgi:hypothetical protein